MLGPWPDMKIVCTDGKGNIIQEVQCGFCGAKESVKNILKADSETRTELDIIQRDAEWSAKFNDLWRKIKSLKVDLYEALYEHQKLMIGYGKDKFAGASSVTGRANTTCKECGQPIGCDVQAESKIRNEMPQVIDTDIWKALKPPPSEIIARLLKDIGGTVQSWINDVHGGNNKFQELNQFLEKTQKELSELDVEDLWKTEFETFLREFREWIHKEQNKIWNLYANALLNLATHAVVHGALP